MEEALLGGTRDIWPGPTSADVPDSAFYWIWQGNNDLPATPESPSETRKAMVSSQFRALWKDTMARNFSCRELQLTKMFIFVVVWANVFCGNSVVRQIKTSCVRQKKLTCAERLPLYFPIFANNLLWNFKVKLLTNHGGPRICLFRNDAQQTSKKSNAKRSAKQTPQIRIRKNTDNSNQAGITVLLLHEQSNAEAPFSFGVAFLAPEAIDFQTENAFWVSSNFFQCWFDFHMNRNTPTWWFLFNTVTNQTGYIYTLDKYPLDARRCNRNGCIPTLCKSKSGWHFLQPTWFCLWWIGTWVAICGKEWIAGVAAPQGPINLPTRGCTA